MPKRGRRSSPSSGLPDHADAHALVLPGPDLDLLVPTPLVGWRHSQRSRRATWTSSRGILRSMVQSWRRAPRLATVGRWLEVGRWASALVHGKERGCEGAWNASSAAPTAFGPPSSHRQEPNRHVPGGRIRARWEGSQPHQPAGVNDPNVVSNYRVTRSAAPRRPQIRLERSNSGRSMRAPSAPASLADGGRHGESE